MNPIKIMNTNDIIGMMIIDPAEYNRLKQENIQPRYWNYQTTKRNW